MRVAANQTVCQWATVNPSPPAPGTKLGVAVSTIGQQPINGLRHLPTNDTSGWYIWCGSELSEESDFFVPLHIEHIAEYLPAVLEYLDLPPGYRFLIDGANYEDVWYDETLIKEAE